MFKGETVASGAPLPYPEAQPEVLKSGAGYYIGYQSQYGEPYSRETIYMDKSTAIRILNNKTWEDREWIRI